MADTCVLAIDLGTTNCKILAIDEHLNLKARINREYPVSIPKPGWSEQDPESWWSAVREAVREVSEQIGADCVKSIGLSGQMHGLVALDNDQRVLRPAILWNDQRSQPQCDLIYEKTGGVEGLRSHTNNYMLPGFTGGKILWMRENEPHLFQAVDKILLPKDYLRLRLTGGVGTDFSDASGTGLFDVRNHRWADGLLDLLELPRHWFPPCSEAGEIAGTLLPTVASELGLAADTPVIFGGGDAVMQTVGGGAVDSDSVLVVIGTGGNVTVSVPSCPENPGGNLQVFCHVLPGRWVSMGVSLTAGSSLKWYRDSLAGLEALLAEGLGKDTYELLGEQAARSPAGANGLFFLPYLQGERCPHTDPFARGCFIGLSLRSSKADMVRSIMEGVAYSQRDMFELITGSGINPHHIHISGGGAASPLWRQILADVFNREVSTEDFGEDASALGAGIVAGTTAGLWSSAEQATRQIKRRSVNTPDPERVELYRKMFDSYRSLYPLLADTFKKLIA